MNIPLVSGLTIPAAACALLAACVALADGIAVAPTDGACKPQLIQKGTRFPLGSQLRGQRGTVHVSVVIDANGRPQKAALQRSSGYRKLDRAAARSALERWVFDVSGCKREDLPVAHVVAVEYRNDAD